MNFLDAKKIYFIAIGGIAVSAMAKLCQNRGILVTGSDQNESEITKDLQENFGITLTIGSNPELIDDSVDYVIYSPAVPEIDPEYQKALSLGIPIISNPEAQGILSQQKTTIAIAGTNGKTTTTSMLVEAMKDQEINPTVIVGAMLEKYNSNFLHGDSEYFVLEACEYKRSFLNIHHDVAVITNITEDHLDYFKDFSDIQSAFIEFVNNKKDKGVLVCNKQLPELKNILEHTEENKLTIIDYSRYLSDEYQISIPGEHNRQNMAAALAVVEALGLNIEKASEYLATKFSGAKRRMEYIGKTKSGALLYDDYAHNPEGIECLIDGLRDSFPEKKIVILFEPHLYSRTEDFKEEFGRVLAMSDILYLFPVYKAREESQPERDFLLEKYINLDESFYTVKNPQNFKELFESKNYDDNYIVITVGAGDIWQKGLEIKKQS